jgi:hypothetical protein
MPASAPGITRPGPLPTRESALDALVQAVDNQDRKALEEIFGPEFEAFQQGQQGEPGLQDLRSRRFIAALREFHSFVSHGDGRYTLVVGSMAWPFPIPLVHAQGSWQFDGAAGIEELRNRIVGANELNAIALLDIYAAAQQQYSQADHDGDGVLEFAQQVVSTAGTRDGLYWEADTGNSMEQASPLDLLKNLSDALMGEREPGDSFLGYHFRILYGQGPHAKAGAYDYLINGHLLGGYAMLAWPADYGETGVMSFMVNQDRVIYQADLGEETAEIAAGISRFDPGPGWLAVPDEPHGELP